VRFLALVLGITAEKPRQLLRVAGIVTVFVVVLSKFSSEQTSFFYGTPVFAAAAIVMLLVFITENVPCGYGASCLVTCFVVMPGVVLVRHGMTDLASSIVVVLKILVAK
jgi:phosphatidylserine synthase